ncbi:MAG: hypothetical protein D6690_18020 [Nitrospirae bacterium]|nr:MAG: hypothetical protein D6690_18020 [Nitrospirota bacterium]
MTGKPIFLSLLLCGFAIFGCSIKASPPLDASLGMEAFERMGTIDQRNIALALFLDPKLRDLTVEQSIKIGDFTFDVGKAFSAKLIKALAYNFKTIHLITTPSYHGDIPVNAIMRVALQDVDVNMGVKAGFATVGTQAYSRIAIRADILDPKENKTVWVGTSQAKAEGSHEDVGQMSYQEAGRGFAGTIGDAIDRAIGDLLAQMSKSESLRTYLIKWERENHDQ